MKFLRMFGAAAATACMIAAASAAGTDMPQDQTSKPYADYEWAFNFSSIAYDVKQFVPPYSDTADADTMGLGATAYDGGAVTPAATYASQYSIDCSGDVFRKDYVAGAFGTFSQTGSELICIVSSAPVFDGPTLVSQLASAGYTYSISFPITNNGNNRGLITWASAESNGAGGHNVIHQGFARITGMVWNSQYDSRTACSSYSGTTCTGFTTYPYSDTLGNFVNALSSSDRATVVRLYQAGYSSPGFTKVASLVKDPWLNLPNVPPTPPALPTLPGVVAGTTANNLALAGATGNIAGVGISISPNNASRVGTPFDYVTYCNGPDPSGGSHTPAWIANCLSSQ